MKRNLLVFNFLLLLLTLNAQNTIITGKVIDVNTQLGIPYANIGFPKQGIGTSANEKGEFVLKISKEHPNDTLQVSSMGYKTQMLEPKQLQYKSLNIRLEPNEIHLKEFVFRSVDAKKIVQQVLKKRKNNYNTVPASLQVFCRESTQEKNSERYLAHAEGVIEVYKAPYDNINDAVQLLKGRKKTLDDNVVFKNSIFKFPEIVQAPHIPILADVIKTPNLFLENYKQYHIAHTGYETIGDYGTYVLEFEPSDSSKRVLESYDADFFRGKMYIDTLTHTLIRAEYSLSSRGLRAVNIPFFALKSTLFLKNRRFIVNYAPYQNMWFFKSANLVNEYDWYYPNEKIAQNGINPSDSITSVWHKIEAYVTKISTDNVQKIAKDKRLERDISLGQKINHYDDSFWEEYNFIKGVEDDTNNVVISQNRSLSMSSDSAIQTRKDTLKFSQKRPTEDIKKVSREEVVFSKIAFEQAKEMAKKEQKYIFIDAYADWCRPCKKMASEAFQNPDIAEKMNTFFINLKMNVDYEGKDFAQKNFIRGLPTVLFFNGDGKEVNRLTGYFNVSAFEYDIDDFLKTIPLGALYMRAKEDFEKNVHSYDKAEYYARVRKALGMSTDVLTDILVKKLTKEELGELRIQQLLTVYSTDLDSKTFEYFLKNKDLPIFTNKLKRLVDYNFKQACKLRDNKLLKKVLKANTLIINNSIESEKENKRLLSVYETQSDINELTDKK